MWLVVGIKAKVGSNPFIKCPSEFPLILWHPYARHHYFCVMTEKEQKKWHAVLQDCVRHCDNGMHTCTQWPHYSLGRRKALISPEITSSAVFLPVLHPGQLVPSQLLLKLQRRVCVSVCHTAKLSHHLSELWVWDAAGMMCICVSRRGLGYSVTCFCRWIRATYVENCTAQTASLRQWAFTQLKEESGLYVKLDSVLISYLVILREKIPFF